MLQPRKYNHKGVLLASCLLFLVLLQSALGNVKESYEDAEDEEINLAGEEFNSNRVKRDDSGLTTVFLIKNEDDFGRNGRSARPSGVLTSTARTFVHDGTTTEYGTQVIGTTLENGKYYAQLLHTSSRIYFGSNEKSAIKSKPDERAFYRSRYIGIPQNLDNYIHTSVFHSFQPSEPVFIYPSRGANSGENFVHSDKLGHQFVGGSKSHESKSQDLNGKKEIFIYQNGGGENFSTGSRQGSGEREVLENLIRLEKVDLYDKGKIDEIKPTRVFSNQLPTVTIRYDFSPSGFSINAEEKKEERIVKTEKTKLRSGKSFVTKPVTTKYDTVTYTGFADFVTTVGSTVIIFMPSTRSGDQTVKETPAVESVTSDKSDPHVKTTIKTFLTYSPGMVTKTIPGHGLSMQTTLPTMVADRKSKGLGDDLELKSSVLAEEQISFENPVYSADLLEPSEIVIEPSESMTYSSISRTAATEPLETFSTAVTKTFGAGKTHQPLGLLKSIGGTKAHNGTTTHFTSLIYGTYLDGSYAQILQTSSSVFYLLENGEGISPTVTLDNSNESTESTESDSASEIGKSTTQFVEETTPATTEQGDELLETSGPDYGDDEKHESDVTSESAVTAEGVTEGKEINKARKIQFEAKEQEIGVDADKSEKEETTEKTEVFETATQELITRLVPSTVYKTFTYLTTFFIPSDETTTTSIRSREVVTSDVNLVTKIIDPELVYKEVLPTSDFSTKSGGLDALNDLNDMDEEFRLPSVRVLAPEEIIVIEDTDDKEGEEEEEERYLQTTTDEESTERGTTNVFLTTWNTSPNTEGTDTETTLPETTSESSAAAVDRETGTTPLTTTSETSEKISSTTIEMEEPKISENKTAEKGESGDEEIEVIFKTLYTTYTYLTTYFQESTTSVSSSEVVVTNIITSTLAISPERPEPTSVLKQEVEATETPGKIEGEENEEDINPTSTFSGGSETKFFDDDDEDDEEDDDDDDDFTLSPSKELAGGEVTQTPALEISGLKTLYTTYTYYTTLIDEGSTEVQSRTEVVTNVVGPNSVSVLPSSILQNEALLKSKFEMLLREQQSLRAAATKSSESPSSTLVKSSVRNSSLRINPGSTTGYRPSSTAIQPLSSLSSKQRSDSSGRLSSSTRGSSFQKFSIRPTASIKGNNVPFTRRFNEPTEVEESSQQEGKDGNSVKRLIIKGDKKDRTVIRKRVRTKLRPPAKTIDVDEKLGITTIRLDPTPVDDEKLPLQTMVTDVKSSSSGGGRQIRIAPPEPVERIGEFFYDDQISSESNTDEIEPSPTLILQTSYTTFTYFTTVYKGSSSSDVISRLETVTNVVTETVKPDLLGTQNLSPEDATLPITYFTTFTYWTTLYKDGNTVITSREETVSNIITPTIDPSSTYSVVQKTKSPSVSKEDASVSTVFVPGFITASISQPPGDSVETESSKLTDSKNEIAEVLLKKEDFVEKLKPTTFYTTYTYFTTSYIGDSTVLKSRLETITSVIVPTPTISNILVNDLQTAKSINLESSEIVTKSEEKKTLDSSTDAFPTGLLSTVVSSNVEDGKTTLFSTDIYGTFIDGLYAKILESTTKVVTPVEVTSTPSRSSETQKTGIVSINEGKIIDADGVSTTFFTTKAIGTSIEELYAQVVETTTSVLVDNDKKSSLAKVKENQGGSDEDAKTGLLNLTEGSIIQDGTTTFYESRVVGTVIEGKYVQIIQSKSSLKIEASIAPSVTITTQITPTSTVEITSPSPSAVEGSIVDETVSSKEEHEEREGSEEDEEGGGEDGEDERDRGRVKSRLTFQTKRRTFTPVIRPFASRNRPTFLPKKKSLGSTGAQTITRANFTPTITATLATKTEAYTGRNRFGGGRKSSSVNYSSDVKPTATNSRKFGRNRSSFGYSSSGVSSTYSASRNRISSSRINSTPTLNSARGRANFRSSSRAGYNFESGSFKQSIGVGRPRIRPTLSNFPGRGLPSATATTNLPSDKGNDLTTIVNENDDEGTFTEDEDDVPVTTAPLTTTEDSNLARRNNNPLLRFRRPLLPKTPTTASPPKSTTTQAPRRGILGGRNNRFTAPTTPRGSGRTPVNIGRSNLPSRSRPTNNLFPPRGLFKKPPPAEVEKEEEEFFDEEEEEEFENEDNNYDESSAKEIEAEVEIKKTEKVGRGRAYNPVSIRPFNLHRRSKRQVSDYGSKSGSLTPRYRRPKLKAHQAQERIDYDDEEVTPSEVPKTTRNGRVHKPRSRSHQSHQTQTTNPPTQSRIRPTTASSQNSQRPQFTLREKDTSSNPRTSNFRRGQGSSTRRKSSSYKATEPTVSSRKSSRTRTQPQNQALSDLTRNNQRRGGYSNGRKLTPTRSRSRFGESEDTYTYQSSAFDGTITVTHKIPSEVTIPIVSGKVTEYRNIITAKPSIEVLGPHQYTVANTNGGTVLFLNREVTETLNNGFTEVTKFLIHETPTTSVVFTPTTIRGRKTSFSHIVPSTVYDVENVVTTIQPQIAANAPLANLLLSQLLLGNLNVPPNQPLGGLPLPQTTATPTTEYKVRTTSYVTTVTDHISTVLPITFRGKEILTTIVDDSVNVITATEYITDTVVITPSLSPNQQINSLLLPALLQAQLLNSNQQPTPPQLPPIPAFTQLPFAPSLGLDQLKFDALQQQDIAELTEDKPSRDNDLRLEIKGSDFASFDEVEEVKTPSRKRKSRKKSDKRRYEPEPAGKEIVTLYVSGRRPGEFSTILSTVVTGGETSVIVRKREALFDEFDQMPIEASGSKNRVSPSQVSFPAEVYPDGEPVTDHLDYYVTPATQDIFIPVRSEDINSETQSLESVLGDVSKHTTKRLERSQATKTSLAVEPTSNDSQKESEKSLF